MQMQVDSPVPFPELEFKFDFGRLEQDEYQPESRYLITRTLDKAVNKRNVYVARDQITENLVVVKKTTMRPAAFVLENPETECRVMKMLQEQNQDYCPNLIRMYDYFETDRHRCAVLEYCTGGDLFEYVEKNGKLDEDLAKNWIKQIISGLSFLHDNGVAHLDVSMENVLIAKDEDDIVLKICDLGMCQFMEEAKYLSFEGAGPGKKGYKAPEVYKYAEFDGKLADAYSVGVILFILLFGFPPYERPSPKDKRFQLIASRKLGRLCRLWGIKDMPSDEAIDLLESLICFENRRLSLDEMLEHPWLIGEQS